MSIRPATLCCALAVLAIAAGAPRAAGDETVITTLADFEDDSVAAVVTGIKHVLAANCSAQFAAIPARGRRSLMLEIGATGADAHAACDLRFRVATPFASAQRVAVQAWIKKGAAEISFRVRDATGRTFETPPLAVTDRNRWVRLTSDLKAKNLKPTSAAGESSTAKLVWPIEIRGCRIHTDEIGRQEVYLDDLEVEHRAGGASLLRGEFELDSPTHLYEPGAVVYANLVIENTSLRRAMPLTVQMRWFDSDGVEIASSRSSRSSLNLPHRDAGFRSRQPVAFDQRLAKPGLYRLVALVRAQGWITPAVFETTVAATYSNRGLPRGRETFFGVRTNLLREPSADQLGEILIAREIGVQLLAVETPWTIIEPDAGALDLAPLDKLIKRIVDSDMAIMIVLTDPPAWVGGNQAEFWKNQQRVLVEFARRFGGRIAAYQALAPPGAESALDPAPIKRLRAALTAIRPDALVIAPPLPVLRDGKNAPAAPTPSDDDPQWAFETRGDSAAALAALDTYATRQERAWRPTDRWLHEAAPLVGPGETCDAVAVLRHFVTAAENKVSGVVWFDLRDDANDPRRAAEMCGMVRRDYSPKTPLLGLANAIGMLHGLLYAGPLPGTPDEFDTALFMGGTRQVAVLFPKPNRVLPAVLAPYHLAESAELTVLDFARRRTRLLHTGWTPLTPTMHTPFFIELESQRAEGEVRIGLARPWLRVPADIYCGETTTFAIELDAHAALRRSYLTLKLPPGAPYESSLSSRTLRAAAGDALSFDVTLTRTDAPTIAPTVMTLRVSLEGRAVEVPVRLHTLWPVRSASRSADITKPAYLLGRLRPDADASGVDATLHAAWRRRSLQLAVSLPDDAAPDAVLHVGVALEGADKHAEARVSALATKPAISASYGTDAAQLRGWRSRCASAEKSKNTVCEITIPARSLGLSEFKAGSRVLLAVRYEEPRQGKLSPPLRLNWGSGLGGKRETSGYQWVELTAAN